MTKVGYFGVKSAKGLFHGYTSAHETATKRSLFDKRDEGSRRRRALGVYKWDNAQEHGDHLGPCYCRISEIRRPRAQTGERPSSRLEWRLSGARKRLLTKLRVHHGLPVANMVEGHHEGVLHAACGP
jgi:hypothetical protein